MNNQFVMLDVNGLTDILVAASRYYAANPIRVLSEYTHGPGGVSTSHHQVVDCINPIDARGAIKIVEALVKERISQSVRYLNYESAIPVIASVLTGKVFPTEEELNVTEHFISHPDVDGVCIELADQVSRYVQPRSWQQWEVITTRSAVALVGTKDYRIDEWERYHAVVDEDQSVSVDVHTIAQYMWTKLTTHYGELANHISIPMLIMDAIHRLYPNVELSKQYQPITDAFLNQLGDVGYIGFCKQFVDPVMHDFGVMFVLHNLKNTQRYRAELNTNFTLVFHPLEETRESKQRYFSELRESMERGDYIPPSERRRLEEHERLY